MPFSLKLECMSKNSCNKSCHVTYSNSSCSLSGKGCGEGGTLVCELAQSQVKVHFPIQAAVAKICSSDTSTATVEQGALMSFCHLFS